MKMVRPDSRPVGAKLKPYECGVPAESDARGRYSVRFYIIAILFVIFDVETVFLLPFAVAFKGLTPAACVAMLIFILLLAEGLVWACAKGVLEWE